MNIAKLAESKTFSVIPTPHAGKGDPPICVLCEKEIETEFCFVSVTRDGFYLHPICGGNIEVKVA